jgi:hypothetical protein
MEHSWYLVRTLIYDCGEWSVSSLEYTELDDFHFKCLHVQQKQFIRVLEARY